MVNFVEQRKANSKHMYVDSSKMEQFRGFFLSDYRGFPENTNQSMEVGECTPCQEER